MKYIIKKIIEEINFILRQDIEYNPDLKHAQCELEIGNKIIDAHIYENILNNEVYVWDKEKECYLENISELFKSYLPFWYDLTPDHNEYNEWNDHGFHSSHEYYSWRGIR